MKLLVGIVAVLAVVLLLGCVGGGAGKVASGITDDEIDTVSSDMGGVNAPLDDINGLDEIDVSGIDQAFA